MTTTFVERFGITREQLRQIVARRQRAQIAREQAERDETLRRLGAEFRSEQPERRERKPRPVPASTKPRKPRKPPLIETDGCVAFHCPNAGEQVVTSEFSGRLLRVRYCATHAAEVRIEKAAG